MTQEVLLEKIVIKNAYEHNLKHINLEIPINKLTCVTGCSGCGKSSLVFDTIYAESQRCFLECMTGIGFGQKLMSKPHVDSIENLRPALNVSQNYYNVNPRSTIGTMTDISYYLRSLFALLNNSRETFVSESFFSSNNPKYFCANCSGLGFEMVVSRDLLIPDQNKTLRDGGIVFFKGNPEGKEQRYLEALCELYGIDINKKISELTEKEVQLLLYSNEKVKHKLSFKEGRRKRQLVVFLQGAASIIMERVAQLDSSTSIYSKYMEETVCHVCKGAKLKSEVLKYQINGKNYNEIENLELSALKSWLCDLDFKLANDATKELAKQLIQDMLNKIEPLLLLNTGYLCLSRTIPSLSGGERQRIRIATQLTCPLKGLIYILDEPCKGLHYRDVGRIVEATHALIKNGNTVIAIEHNLKYISYADNVILLGPSGGPEGGYVLSTKKDKSPFKLKLKFKAPVKTTDYVHLHNINFRNIQHQSVSFPVGGITCITGVSGSGKSTLVSVICSCLEKRKAIHCHSIEIKNSFKKIVQVNQAPIGKTPRSTIVSYLEIFDEIRKLFAATDKAKALKLDASLFSMNVKGGRCECCQGTGLKKIELNYLPSSYIVCPECNGKRFIDSILSVTYKGKNIQEILESSILDIIEVFHDSNKIYSILSSMIELGLGYLKLGQMSMNLSGGEAQRIKLAKALGNPSKGQTIYILDEPTSGLNEVDIVRFEEILFTLQKKKATLVIVEHNIDFIARVADYVIDFGIQGGSEGGIIAAQGLPKDVFNCPESSLYHLDT